MMLLFCIFYDILSLNVKMYLWLKLYTVPFFVSGQTYKISKGSNNYCSHCICTFGWHFTPFFPWSFHLKSQAFFMNVHRTKMYICISSSSTGNISFRFRFQSQKTTCMVPIAVFLTPTEGDLHINHLERMRIAQQASFIFPNPSSSRWDLVRADLKITTLDAHSILSLQTPHTMTAISKKSRPIEMSTIHAMNCSIKGNL